MQYDGPERRLTVRNKPLVDKTLIAEDEDSWMYVFKKRLANISRVIECASTLTECYEKIKGQHFDFIVLDRMFTDGDSFEQISKIKNLAPNSYIVLVTTYGRQEDAELMRNKTVLAVIDKLQDLEIFEDIFAIRNGLDTAKGKLK
jgi:CheY-like chemotaxis protein